MTSPLQSWDPETYALNARFVADLGESLINVLKPQKGERILDLGCGDGALTRKLMEAGATVVGVDASEPLISAARVAGVDARLMDAHDLGFDGEFDAVFTNAVLHWVTDPPRVIAGVRKALKKGGRFVGEFGGFGNVAAICTAMRAALKLRGQAIPDHLPWYFPTEADFRGVLLRNWFEVEPMILFPRPTPLPTDLRGWLETFGGPFVTGLGPATAPPSSTKRSHYSPPVSATPRGSGLRTTCACGSKRRRCNRLVVAHSPIVSTRG